jgi:DNA repair protein RecN (Recombination protein N)
LTRKRRRGAKKLAEAVRRELSDLAFGDAGFDVTIATADGEPGPTGADRVELIVALNPGEGAHSLSRVASGGELSRLMLAARRALAGVGPVGTYVFDEVDAGIGGAVATAVGGKLREVAAHHQVICITHLPQIASLADTHLVVTKTTRKGRTQTDVSRLDERERVQEIARMLGGGRPTETAEAAARELMGT